MLLAMRAVIATGTVTLPDETFSSPKQLQAILLDIQQRSLDSAVARMQSLLDTHGSELSRIDDDSLTAVDDVFASMSAADRLAISPPYEAKFGAAATELLNQIREKPNYRPQDLYAVAKRFPFTRAAGIALAASGDRAADQGDLPSARVFYSLAASHGWQADAAERIRISQLDIPTNETTEGAFGAAGPLPFDAPWYNLATGFEKTKVFPVGSGDLAFVAGEHSVLAFKSDGIVAWRWEAPPALPSRVARFQSGNTGRGRQVVPAMLADDTGRARIVIVAQPTANNGSGCLIALRASDGQQLWSTDAEPLLRSSVFLGSPVVEGRYVIAVGLETIGNDGTTAALQLVAVDVTNGQLLWRTPLASVNTNQVAHDLDLYRDQSPPAVADDCVFVTPNVGALFAVDRFDGELRWVRPYRQAVIGDGAIRKYVDQRHRGRDLIAPLAWTDLLRWNCTPLVTANVIITAPQDTVAVMGLDSKNGKLLWESGNLPQATPVGIAGGKLILSGASLTAVDPNTGLKAWSFTPVAGVRLTGPAVVRGNEILVRSTAGLLTVSPADGSSAPSESTVDFHPAAASEAGKAALAGAGLNEAFGIPPGRN
jgi:outer membrane protein assembly factor BamB